MPNLGPDYDMAVRLKALEDRLARLEANPYGQALSMTQSDGSIGLSFHQDPTSGAARLAVHQGPDTARDPATNQHPDFLYLGEGYINGTPIGAAMLLYYENSQLLAAFDSQGFELFDPQGNIIASNDQLSGEGLGDPWLPLALPTATGVGSWPQTATSGTIASAQFRAMHPKVQWSGVAYSDSGVTGTVQVTVTDGGGHIVASGQTYNLPGGSFVNYGFEVVSLPQPFWGSTYTLNITAQVTGGTGNVYSHLRQAYGRQS